MVQLSFARMASTSWAAKGNTSTSTWASGKLGRWLCSCSTTKSQGCASISARVVGLAACCSKVYPPGMFEEATTVSPRLMATCSTKDGSAFTPV